jgi:hypothetical protein
MWVNSLYSYTYLNQQKPLFFPIIAYTLYNKIRDKGKIVSAGYWGGGGEREGVEWVVGGWGQGGEMTQALYAHMNNKIIIKKWKKNKKEILHNYIQTFSVKFYVDESENI